MTYFGKLVHTAFERSTAILTQSRSSLEQDAKRLLEHETLSEEEIPVIAAVGLPALEPDGARRLPRGQR